MEDTRASTRELLRGSWFTEQDDGRGGFLDGGGAGKQRERGEYVLTEGAGA